MPKVTFTEASCKTSDGKSGRISMPTYSAPVDDTLFLLKDVFGYERYSNLPGFSDAPLDLVEAILKEGAKFTEEVLQPINQSGDQEGCTRNDDGTVSVPKASRKPTTLFAKGAGELLPLMRITADKVCRTRWLRSSMNLLRLQTWPSPCTRD
jgi:hypothetical protein